MLVTCMISITMLFVLPYQDKVSDQTAQLTTEDNSKDKSERVTTNDAAIDGQSTVGYLLIPDFNLKIKMRDSDKITYSHETFDEPRANFKDESIQYNTSIEPVVKSEYLVKKSCSDQLSISLTFLFDEGQVSNLDIGGSPYYCSDNPNDIALWNRVLEDFRIENISKIKS